MKFEHLVQINDPLMPLLDPLTRSQVWRGLVRRAEDPVPFILGLDDCRILARGPDWLRRELHFGQVVLVDEVHFEPEQRIVYRSADDGPHAGSSLVVTIEEPGPYVLFVRFAYETLQAVKAFDDARYDDARRNAYREADIDTVRKIRQFAAQGQLD